jgi:signal transduction histidine kinase
MRRWLPRPTLRLRLTVLYGAVFLVAGAVLLTITYELVANSPDAGAQRSFVVDNGPVPVGLPPPIKGGAGVELTAHQRIPPGDTPPGTLQAYSNQVAAGFRRLTAAQNKRLKDVAFKARIALRDQQSAQRGTLLTTSGIALGIMAIISIGLGWLLAGRALRPVRTMSARARGISERNLHERLALAGPDDELKELGDTFDELLGRLESAFESQRQFVANASHELRTPMAMMRTTLDVAIAKPGGVPAQTRELDGELRVDLDHADRLLEGFLTLARAQNGQPNERAQVALEPLITAALIPRANRIADQRLTVATHLAAVETTGSPTLLRRMIENVIENAVCHNQPGGSIELTLAPLDGQQAQVIIDSSGSMLDQRAVAQLAQPFKRLVEDRTGSQNGHGLGLSIVAAIVAAHDGRLDLRARAEGGLRVQITLPATTVPQLARARE